MDERRANKSVITTTKRAARPVEFESPPGVFHRFILYGTIVGAAIGGILLGLLFYLIAAGRLVVAGLGMLAASGTAPAAFVGAGVGIAAGGLAGALWMLFRIPPPARPGD